MREAIKKPSYGSALKNQFGLLLRRVISFVVSLFIAMVAGGKCESAALHEVIASDSYWQTRIVGWFINRRRR